MATGSRAGSEGNPGGPPVEPSGECRRLVLVPGPRLPWDPADAVVVDSEVIARLRRALAAGRLGRYARRTAVPSCEATPEAPKARGVAPAGRSVSRPAVAQITLPGTVACAWCGSAVRPRAVGRPRRTCSQRCRSALHRYEVETRPMEGDEEDACP